MADDHDRDGASSADGEPDATREFDPFPPGSSSEPGDSETTDPDRTAQLPAADDTRPIPAADETAQLPPASAPAPWSGRAGVPPPDATAVRGPAPGDWEPPAEGPGGRWWLPIVLGIVGLLLLGGLVAGIWLIIRADDDEPATTPTPTTAPTSAPATSAAPTTSPPAPPTSGPVSVPIPPLVGLTDEQARDRLDALGLTYRLVFEPSDEPAGTVIETDPPAGVAVPEGSQVTLVIAIAPPTSAPPTSASPTAGPTPG